MALQELVKRVFADEQTRTEFMSDPGSVMSRFELTDSEKKAVMATRMKLGLVTEGSVQMDEVIGPLAVWI